MELVLANFSSKVGGEIFVQEAGGIPLSQMHGSSVCSAEALARSDLDALQW